MQFIVAPSKTMTMSRAFPAEVSVSVPRFQYDARYMVDVVRHLSQIMELMHVSQPLSEQIAAKYRLWGSETLPCVFAYVGDVYKGFFADTLSVDDLLWAQKHMFILSGLYGLLRPMDEISPYRLEMKTKLYVDGKADLYAFWGDRLARYIDESKDGVICCLSSDEYARVITRYTTKRVVTPVFLDRKISGGVGAVPIYSKMMRGVMARWMIDHRANTPEELLHFKAQGYSFDQSRSTPNYPAFRRDDPQPIRFT